MTAMPKNLPGRLVLLAIACVSPAPVAFADESAVASSAVLSTPLVATLELGAPLDGAVGSEPSVSGPLEAITERTIRLRTAVGSREIPTLGVRRLELTTEEADAVVSDRRAADPEGDVVEVRFVGGGVLRGERFVWQRDSAILTRAGRDATFPIEAVELVSWSVQAGSRPAGSSASAWLEALPERPDGDLVVVRRGEGFECVECAMLEVNDEHVVVMLDGERIPVRRDRVAGLRWLRPAESPAAGRLDVRVAGGRLPAATVHWSPERLVLDGRLVFPAESLRSIDYAAGRTVRLATLEPERVEVRPLLDGTADSPRLAAFFAPRSVPVTSGIEDEALLVRPRTVMVWRVPPDSRVFRARAVAGGGRTSLAIGVDDREPLRWILAAAPGAPVECPIEIDVAAGRRLSIVVDLPDATEPENTQPRATEPENTEPGAATGGLGGPVRLDRAVFEP